MALMKESKSLCVFTSLHWTMMRCCFNNISHQNVKLVQDAFAIVNCTINWPCFWQFQQFLTNVWVKTSFFNFLSTTINGYLFWLRKCNDSLTNAIIFWQMQSFFDKCIDKSNNFNLLRDPINVILFALSKNPYDA